MHLFEDDLFFFFKQKTAYEMRISDWSSDVCSSDLLNGRPVAGIAVQATPGANALATAEGVKARMKELATSFPQDITWSVPYDTTPFINASITEVVKTLIEAMVLVFLVDRKSVVSGKSGSVRVNLGGRRIIKKKK